MLIFIKEVVLGRVHKSTFVLKTSSSTTLVLLMSYLATHLLENSVLLYSSAHIKFVRHNLKISHHTHGYIY
jgi:hypothetical protein